MYLLRLCVTVVIVIITVVVVVVHRERRRTNESQTDARGEFLRSCARGSAGTVRVPRARARTIIVIAVSLLRSGSVTRDLGTLEPPLPAPTRPLR